MYRTFWVLYLGPFWMEHDSWYARRFLRLTTCWPSQSERNRIGGASALLVSFLCYNPSCWTRILLILEGLSDKEFSFLHKWRTFRNTSKWQLHHFYPSLSSTLFGTSWSQPPIERFPYPGQLELYLASPFDLTRPSWNPLFFDRKPIKLS